MVLFSLQYFRCSDMVLFPHNTSDVMTWCYFPTIFLMFRHGAFSPQYFRCLVMVLFPNNISNSLDMVLFPPQYFRYLDMVLFPKKNYNCLDLVLFHHNISDVWSWCYSPTKIPMFGYGAIPSQYVLCLDVVLFPHNICDVWTCYCFPTIFYDVRTWCYPPTDIYGCLDMLIFP